MPDLEKSIANWRQQMLAAGIKRPVPLEELEIHLREEIERQVKLGLNEQKALEIPPPVRFAAFFFQSLQTPVISARLRFGSPEIETGHMQGFKSIIPI